MDTQNEGSVGGANSEANLEISMVTEVVEEDIIPRALPIDKDR